MTRMDVRMPTEADRSAKIPKKFVRIRMDIPLFLLIVTMLIFGALMVYSASADFSYRTYSTMTYIFRKQVEYMFLGMVIAIVLMLTDYHRMKRVAMVGMLGTIVLLIIVKIVAEIRLGAGRALFGGSVQPSELVKLVMILYLAVWLCSKREKLSDIAFGLVPLTIMIMIVAGLIYIQPDLSAALTIVIMGGIMFFLAGADWKQIVTAGLVVLVMGFFFIKFNPTGSVRITEFINGLKDLLKGSYHVRRSIEAFVTGGWFGVGIGQSDTKLTGLPFPQTDSIFAVVSEETGVLGATGLIMMYVLILWRSLVIAKRAPDGLGRLLAAGIGIWITLEAFFNIGSMLNVFPIAGNSLPLISAGGSNLLVTLAGLGIVLNVSRQSMDKKLKNEWRLFNAVVNLRRGNRGWRVSRTRRSAGARTYARK